MPATAPPAAVRSADRDRDGLVVVEQQRRQRGAGAEPVAAGRGRGVASHRIAEFAQPVDVVADGPGAHLEPSASSAPVQLASGLQQGEQAQQAGRGVQHGSSLCQTLGTEPCLIGP